MRLRELLLTRKDALTKRWLEKTLRTYPAGTAAFLKRQPDQFANPVGHALSTGIQALVDDLLEGADKEKLRGDLDTILRIRSVQDFSPSQAISFVFRLKEAVREEFTDELSAPSRASDLSELDAQVDRLALLAFDVYARCREQIYEARVNDVKRRVSGLMRRVGLGLDDLDGGPDVAVTDLRRQT